MSALLCRRHAYDGEWLADGETEAELDAEGDLLALGEPLADGDTDGDALALGEWLLDGETEADGAWPQIGLALVPLLTNSSPVAVTTHREPGPATPAIVPDVPLTGGVGESNKSTPWGKSTPTQRPIPRP